MYLFCTFFKYYIKKLYSQFICKLHTCNKGEKQPY